MKNIKSLRLLDGIDDDLIVRAAPRGKTGRLFAGLPRLKWAGPLAACLLIALAVFLPRVFDGILPGHLRPGAASPGDPATGDPGNTGPFDTYALFFNRAQGQMAMDNRIMLPMMFCQELTANEIDAIFPGLSKTRAITAVAHFFYHDSSFYGIGAEILSASGLKTRLQMARDKVVLDYVLEGEAKISDVLGTPVTAGYFLTRPNSKGLKNIICFADFQIDGIGYYLELGGDSSLEDELRREFADLIGLLIGGGAPDLGILSPVRPEGWRDDRLSLEEARADDDLGKFIPAVIPDGFLFEGATRSINSNQNEFFACWTKGLGILRWRAGYLREEDRGRITSAADLKNYDLSLYPIPWADSVPEELREIVENPIFMIGELTPEVVKLRSYEVDDRGDEPGERLRFSVLYDGVLVEVNTKGVPAEKVYEMLESIK